MQLHRIKLLKFVTLFATGGTERQVVNLGLGLDSGRFDLHFACLKRWGDLLKEIEKQQLPISEYKIKSFYHYSAGLQGLRFARHMIHDRFQIVHTYGFYPNVFAIPAAKLSGVPVVVASIRDTGAYLTPMQRRVQKFCCHWADCVLVNADAVKGWLIAEGYSAEKIVVIRNGIDLSRFREGEHKGALHRELGFFPEAPLVMMLSRLSKLKGAEYFLQAAARVAARFPQVRFLLLGDSFAKRDGEIVKDSAYRCQLEQEASRLGLDGRVVFMGTRHDVPELLREVAVSVLPSLSEGLSNALLESMAAGVPVVATRVGGSAEAVEDGVTGWLVPPRDPKGLAEAICRLLEHRRMALSFGEAGRQRVADRFSNERMVVETEHLYQRLLQQAPRAKYHGRKGDAPFFPAIKRVL